MTLLGPVRIQHRLPVRGPGAERDDAGLAVFIPRSSRESDDPYHFAQAEGMKVESLDDYLNVLDRLFLKAKEKGRSA